jgi:hypothetical protein
MLLIVNERALLWHMPPGQHMFPNTDVPVDPGDVCLLLEPADAAHHKFVHVFVSRLQRAGWLRYSAGALQ